MAMEIALRYIATAAVIGVAVWYYGGFDRLINQYFSKTPQPSRIESVEKTAKKKKARNRLAEQVNSGTESASANEKKRKISAPVAGTVTASVTEKNQHVVLPRDDDGDMNTKEFARQFAKTQQGISFASSGKQNSAKSKTRTVKQSTADLDSPHMSAENSSTGQDGDDETTPAGSPAFNAVASGVAPDTSGISDMLEAPKDGPKSMRLTGFEEVKPRKQKTAVKEPEPVETKKQRQQRRRREEEKGKIAVSAKEHQAKGQQQMRSARMAEGTSNQTRADSFKAQPNVWTAKENLRPEIAVKQQTAPAAPLDTFEPQPATNIGNEGAVTAQPFSEIKNGSSTTVNRLRDDLGSQRISALAASERERAPQGKNTLERTTSWADDVIDEEEQVRMAMEEDPSSWSQVIKKDKKKARRGDDEANTDSATSAKQVNGQAQKTAAKATTNGTSAKSQAVNRYRSLDTGPTTDELQDDEWEA